MDNLIDFTNCDEIVDIEIDDPIDDPVDNIDVEIDDGEYIYDLIHDNYDAIIKNKELYDVVDPNRNTCTRSFMKNGHDERDAITLSIWTMIYMCKKLIL